MVSDSVLFYPVLLPFLPLQHEDIGLSIASKVHSLM